MNIAPQRYFALDTYRFFAAFFVMIYHYNSWFHLNLESLSPAFSRMGNYVIFFFLLSGFVIGVNYQDKVSNWSSYKSFIKKRLARLYPLHLLTLCLVATAGWLAIFLGLDVKKPEHFDAAFLPQNLFMVHAWGTTPHRTFNGPSWSISAEWFLYLIFPILLFVLNKLTAPKLVLCGLLYIVCLQYLFFISGKGHWVYATYDFSNFSAIPVFFLGLCIARNVDRLADFYKGGMWLSWVMFLISLVVFHFVSVFEIALLFFIVSLCLAVAAEKNGRTSFLQHPWLVALGDASYGIYMYQYGVSLFFLAVMALLGWSSAGSMFLFASLSLLLCLFVALLSYRYFEMPARRWISNL